MSFPRKLFVNVYAPFVGQSGTAYATRELADQMAANSRLACIELDIGPTGVVTGNVGYALAPEAAAK